MLIKSHSKLAILKIANLLSDKFSRQVWIWREFGEYHCDFAFRNGTERQFICRVISGEIF